MKDEKFMKKIKKYVVSTNNRNNKIIFKEGTPEAFKKEYKRFWMGKND